MYIHCACDSCCLAQCSRVATFSWKTVLTLLESNFALLFFLLSHICFFSFFCFFFFFLSFFLLTCFPPLLSTHLLLSLNIFFHTGYAASLTVQLNEQKFQTHVSHLPSPRTPAWAGFYAVYVILINFHSFIYLESCVRQLLCVLVILTGCPLVQY